MNLEPINQTKLYAFYDEFNQLIELHKKKKLPNKILLSGQKGIGKCTFAYHLINYFLSLDGDNIYDLKNFQINEENRYFKLNLNKSNPNFILVDVSSEKKNIDINQIRDLIKNLNKSSFNSKERFVLIDNIEYLNTSSINALLKVIEEPNDDTFFILINNNKKINSTLTSRCIKFNLSLSNSKTLSVCEKLVGENIYNLINEDLIDYYLTPGKIYNLVKFSHDNKVDLSKTSLKDFINLIIHENLYKKETSIKYFIYDFIELFLRKNISLKSNYLFHNFIEQIDRIKRYNLDEESLFIKLRSELING